MSRAEPSNPSMLSVEPEACWNCAAEYDVAVAGEEFAEHRVVLERRPGPAVIDHHRPLAVERFGVAEAGRRGGPEPLQAPAIRLGQLDRRLAEQLLGHNPSIVLGQRRGELGKPGVVAGNGEVPAMRHRPGVGGSLGRIPDVDQDRPRRLAGGELGLVVEGEVVGPAGIELPVRAEPDRVRPGDEPAPERRPFGAAGRESGARPRTRRPRRVERASNKSPLYHSRRIIVIERGGNEYVARPPAIPCVHSEAEGLIRSGSVGRVGGVERAGQRLDGRRGFGWGEALDRDPGRPGVVVPVHDLEDQRLAVLGPLGVDAQLLGAAGRPRFARAAAGSGGGSSGSGSRGAGARPSRG